MFGSRDKGRRRRRGLLRLAAAVSACAAAVIVCQPVAGAAAAPAPTYTKLTLINGWSNYGSGTARAAVTSSSGIVRFRGAIQTGGTTEKAFVLPVSFRPAVAVYVPVDLCNANKGRLLIEPNGAVFVEQENAGFSDAACFTSLDGASFAKSARSFTPLTLRNGWKDYGFGTGKPGVRLISGIVHFRGAIRTGGTTEEAFVLPAGFRPAAIVYTPVDLCGANNGRLEIVPSGAVYVEQENAGYSSAACFTSLDGAWFAKSRSSFTPLTLRNGWKAYGFGTGKPGVRLIAGVVQLRGAIKTTGTSDEPFLIPAGFRPTATVYVPVDLCDANNGRLEIEPSGVVFVQQEKAGFSDASCFTSLEGVSFAK